MAPSSALTAGLAFAAIFSRECRAKRERSFHTLPHSCFFFLPPRRSPPARFDTPAGGQTYSLLFLLVVQSPNPTLTISSPTPTPTLTPCCPCFFSTVTSGQGQWSRGTPPFPLTGRSYAVTTGNQSAFISVGGRRDDNSLSSISLGYDPRELSLTQRSGVEVRPSARYPTTQQPPWRPLPAPYWRSWPRNNKTRAMRSHATSGENLTLTSHACPPPRSPSPPISLPPVRRDAHEPRL
jgi:hypothetical protein